MSDERTGDGVVFPRPQDVEVRDLCRTVGLEEEEAREGAGTAT